MFLPSFTAFIFSADASDIYSMNGVDGFSSLPVSRVKINIFFQVICGTDPYPKNFRAKKYKIKEKFFTKADFQLMMRNLPVPVNEDEIDAMFDFADKDRDGKINYR